MKLTPTQLRKIIMEEVETLVGEAKRGRSAPDFWSVAPGLEQTITGKLASLTTKPNLGDARYREELLKVCNEIITGLRNLG